MPQAFISDFDGTITLKDYYWVMIEKYLDRDEYQKSYDAWQRKDITDLEFLNSAFNNVNQPEDALIQDAREIPIDQDILEFIDWFTANKGDFYIVSAGCEYYIRILLEYHGLLDKVTLYANPGQYHEGNIYMQHYQGEYSSPVYGIDKGKIVADLNQKYKKTYFAGDSRPDFQAAVNAQQAFVRKDTQLEQLLAAESKKFTIFEHFADIQQHLLG